MRRLCVALAATLLALPSQGEEGGSGHYFPGSMASFMDGVSPVPVLIGRVNIIDWEADVFSDKVLPFAGQPVVNADVDSFVVGLTTFWRPSWGTISDKWSYAMSGTLPLVDLKVEGDVVVDDSRTGNLTRRVSDTDTGLGDLVLQPLMLNYHHSPDFNVNMRMTVYAPTGDYKEGRLANAGKNYWSIEPTLALMYFNQKTGWEASTFMGVTLNEENSATDYKSGQQAHIESTLSKHTPMWGGSFGLGVTGYAYRQLDGDTGKGASLGDFKARAYGVGPVASYVTQFNGHEVLFEFKWINEFDVENRPEGNIFFLKAMYYFTTPQRS